MKNRGQVHVQIVMAPEELNVMYVRGKVAITPKYVRLATVMVEWNVQSATVQVKLHITWEKRYSVDPHKAVLKC